MNEISVTVYSTGTACVQCRLTKGLLDDLAIAYEEVDLSDPANFAALEYVTDDLGCSRAPVVFINEEPENYWSGFDPDKIKRLASSIGDHIPQRLGAWHTPVAVGPHVLPIGSAERGLTR